LGGKELSDEVLAWLSAWSEVQMICMWFSHTTATTSSLAPVKSRMVFTFLVNLESAYPCCPGKEAVKWVFFLLFY